MLSDWGCVLAVVLLLQLMDGSGVVVWAWMCCIAAPSQLHRVLMLINELCHPSLTPSVESSALTTLTPPTQSVVSTLCLSNMKQSIKDDGFRQMSVSSSPIPRCSPSSSRACLLELETKVREDFTGLLLVETPTSAFTFKTLLRHYAKRALTPR